MPHPAIAKDNVAVITGGASGIGLAAATHFAALGMKVCIADIGADRLKEAETKLSSASPVGGANIMTAAVDVSRVEDVTALENTVQKRFGGTDVLMNNAGISPSAKMFGPQENWQRVFAVNFWAMERLVRAVLRSMLAARQGRIVLIGWLAATRGSPGNAIYAASKAALSGYLGSPVSETARRGIAANLVAPGFIDTDLLRPYAARRGAIEGQIPAGRYGTAAEVAAAVAFLLSEEAGYISGATLAVDGGLGAVLPVQR